MKGGCEDIKQLIMIRCAKRWQIIFLMLSSGKSLVVHVILFLEIDSKGTVFPYGRKCGESFKIAFPCYPLRIGKT